MPRDWLQQAASTRRAPVEEKCATSWLLVESQKPWLASMAMAF